MHVNAILKQLKGSMSESALKNPGSRCVFICESVCEVPSFLAIGEGQGGDDADIAPMYASVFRVFVRVCMFCLCMIIVILHVLNVIHCSIAYQHSVHVGHTAAR